MNTFLSTGLGGAGAHIHLFQNDLTPDNATVLGDMTEADFDGYAEITPPVEAHGLDVVNHRSFLRWDLSTFTKTAGAVTNIIHGWYVTIPDPDAGSVRKLLMARRYSPALGMLTAGDEIPVHPEFQFDHP